MADVFMRDSQREIYGKATVYCNGNGHIVVSHCEPDESDSQEFFMVLSPEEAVKLYGDIREAVERTEESLANAKQAAGM